MSAAKHTPEPWDWTWIEGEDHDEGNEWVCVADADGEEVAVLMVRNAAIWKTLVGQQREANAARIVACVNACAGLADPAVVPDLLAAMREIAEMGPEDDEWDAVARYEDCRKIARAAIARRNGGAPTPAPAKDGGGACEHGRSAAHNVPCADPNCGDSTWDHHCTAAWCKGPTLPAPGAAAKEVK